MRQDLTPLQEERLKKALIANKKAKKDRVAQYDVSPATCANCEQKLPYDKRKNKFCSHSCAASYNNCGHSSGNLKHGDFAKKPCLYCGKTTDNTKFCSNDCFVSHRRKARIDEFVSSGMASGNPHTMKSYLVEMRGRRCEICEIEKWRSEEVPLVMDHINGKPSDNRLDNLRLVCGNCNMQLPTFAGRNVGKGGGRPYRKKRYLEGKSW